MNHPNTTLYWKGNQDSQGSIVNYGTNNKITGKLIGTAFISSPWGNFYFLIFINSYKGYSTCKDCDVGTFTNVTGKVTCDKCFPGSYSNTSGSINCVTCEPGIHTIYK